MDREGGGVSDKGGGERGIEVVLSYWVVLLVRRFNVGGGMGPFFSEPCFHDDDDEEVANC